MKTTPLQRLALRLRPGLTEITGVERSGQLLNLYGILLNAPLALIGLIWLASQTVPTILFEHFGLFTALLLIAFLLQHFSFELQIELRPGVVASSTGDFLFIISFSALLIFGPTAFWLNILPPLITSLYHFYQDPNPNARWGHASTLANSLSNSLLPALIGLWAYQQLGGQLPFAGFTTPSILQGTVFLLITTVIPYLIASPSLIYIANNRDLMGENNGNARSILLIIFLQSTAQYLALPFILLAAYLYTANGAGIYLFFALAVLLSALLAHQLTENAKQRSQRSRELAALEELGRKIIAAPPDLSSLPDILATQLPQMFHAIREMIWLEPDQILYQSPNSTFPSPEKIRPLLQQGQTPAPHHFLAPGTVDDDPIREGVAVPIRDDAGHLLGGVILSSRRNPLLKDSLPALQSLAAQIASALYRAETHKEALLKARMANELELAGRIQANFLPETIPTLPGYEIAASLTPALQTSGDFYDFIPYPDGKLGLLIADVADKGTGAALFMALTRTLLRTYLLEYPDDPALAFHLTNTRVHEDTQSQLFITTFYGILDIHNHTLTYVNGGHNPPFLFRGSDTTLPEGACQPESLTRTGIPIGMFDDAKWTHKTIPLYPGDLLVLYTDGVTEAQNTAQEFFEETRLQEVGSTNLARSAQQTHEAALMAIRNFVGNAPQFDDITLVVLKRKP